MELRLWLSALAFTFLTAATQHRPRNQRTLESSTATKIVPRFFDEDLASDAKWAKYTFKGGALMCGLNGDDLTAGHQINDPRNPPSAASVWTGDLRQELRDWYWREMTPRSNGCNFDGFWKIGNTLRALGLSTQDGGVNACHKIVHFDPKRKDERGGMVPVIGQRYDRNGREMRATGSELEFIINSQGGAIYGTYLEGPKFAASRIWHLNKRLPEPSQLPDLRSLSDILWGYWVRNNPNVQNIRYFFMLGISNDETNELIARCLKNVGKELKEWPGVTFDTATDEGHALLGSPNGATFAYFLMQHKAQLGDKTITRITVLRPETDGDNDFVDASLLFHVENAPPPPPPPQDDDAKIAKGRGDSAVDMQRGEHGVMHEHRFEI